MELLEREACLQELTAWLESAVLHGGLVVLVSGEAGIGKTSLVHELSKHPGSAKRVLWGACDALFTPRPLAPLHDIASQAKGRLLTALQGEAARSVIFTAALDEIERGPPSLVVFEDLHWADEATLDLVKFVGRRIERTRCLLVLTYREDEVNSRHPLYFVLGELPRASTRRLRLDPLSPSAVGILEKRAGKQIAGLHDATGGNPFFVTEALAAPDDSVPASVRDAVLARTARLSPAALEVAEVASVIPGRAEVWLLKEICTSFEAGIEGCLAIGMVRSADGALSFRHELARRALQDSLPGSRRQTLHARVLSILERRPDTPAARLVHHADGARMGDRVFRFAPVAAAQAAAVGAHRQAVEHYAAALRYADAAAPEERATLLEQLSYESYLTNQIDRAIEARRPALDIWRECGARKEEGNTLRWLSRLSWFAGQRTPAEQYAAEAVSVLEQLPPGPELVMAYSNRAQLEMLSHRAEAAIPWALRAIELCASTGSEEILSHALNNLGSARVMGGDARGWNDLQKSLDLALTHGYQEHAARAYTNLSWIAASARKYEEGLAYLEDGLKYCEKFDLDSWRLYMLSCRARVRFERGDWNEALEDLETVLQHPRTATISRIPALIIAGHLRVLRGDPDAEAPLEEARELVGHTHELQRVAPLAAAFAEAAWISGDSERIVREVEPAYRLARPLPEPWAKGQLALWMWRGGALAQPPKDIAVPFALEMAGDWEGAARAWETLRCPHEQAAALASSGEEQPQLQALAILDRLGATAAASALRRKMRGQGMRNVPRGLQSSTRSHAHGLTKREAQILDLLGEGLRNSTIAQRLFLSTKTVDHHVSSILRKLGVSSRGAAIARMREEHSKR